MKFSIFSRAMHALAKAFLRDTDVKRVRKAQLFAGTPMRRRWGRMRGEPPPKGCTFRTLRRAIARGYAPAAPTRNDMIRHRWYQKLVEQGLAV